MSRMRFMKFVKRAGCIILVPAIAAVIYFIALPLHIHRSSVGFAQDIEGDKKNVF